MGGVIYGKSSTKRGAKLANKDEALIAIMQEISSDKIYWSQIEGSFYRKSLFQKMTDIIEHSFNYENVTVFYEREEIYFPTVLWAIARSESLNVLDGGNYTFVPWSRKNLLTRLSEVIKLIKDPNCHYFSVKRVNRMLNDYVRMYIRQSNGYGDVMAKIVEGVETQPTDELLKLERKSYFKQSVRARWNSFAYYFTHTKEMFFVFKDKFSK